MFVRPLFPRTKRENAPAYPSCCPAQIYLSKKIAIPNGISLHSLSWNPDQVTSPAVQTPLEKKTHAQITRVRTLDQGWIACGGDSGLLKVGERTTDP